MVASDPSALDERKRRILFALCREWVLTGLPVSSLSLAQRHRLEWSSATIRSELVRLEQMGLLHQPHPAAGRYPTAEGLSTYLHAIGVGARPRPEHQRAIDLTMGAAAGGGPATQGSMRSAARVLSELAGGVGIGFVGTSNPRVLERLELVHLGGRQALVVLEMDAGGRSVRRIELAHRPDHTELARLQDHLRTLIVGHTLETAREHLAALVGENEARVDAWLAEALRLGLMLCTTPYLDPLVMQVVGQASLAGVRGVSGDLPRLLELLDDYHRLADVLCQLLPEVDGRAHVRLELALAAPEHGAGANAGLTLVGCRLAAAPTDPSLARAQTGAIAVLGPASMDFEAVIPLVEYAARALANRA